MRKVEAPPEQRASPLPPCPDCGGKMVLSTVLPTMFAADFDNVTYRCTACGTETTHSRRNRGS